MAFSKSVLASSDVIHDFTCTPCSEDGLNNEGINHCVECASYFCGACVQQHNRLIKSHTVSDKSSGKVSKQNQKKHLTQMLPADICEDHTGKVIEMYCGQHDIVCCTICIALNHRNCHGIDYIPNVAKGILTGQTPTYIVSKLEKKRTQLQLMKSRRQEDLAALKRNEKATIGNILSFKESLYARYEKMEKRSVNDVRVKYEGIAGKIEHKICSLDDMLKTVDDNLKDIEQFNGDNESQMFVHVKRGLTVQGKASSVLQEELFFKNSIKYVFNENITSIVNGIDAFGTCTVGENVLLAEYDISMDDDRDDCIIYDICMLDDNQIVISDFNNLKIKRLDTSYRVTDACNVPGNPWGICKTGSSEIAVVLCSCRLVQFVTTETTMSPTRSFRVGSICKGISCFKSEIFVLCETRPLSLCGEIKVFDMLGSCKRSFKPDQIGKEKRFSPQYISISFDGCLYVSDSLTGLLISDIYGKGQRQCTDKRIGDVMGSCFLDSQQVIVCGYRFKYVLIVDSDGKVVKELLGQTDGINTATSMLYLPASRHLLVTTDISNKITVFNCSKLV